VSALPAAPSLPSPRLAQPPKTGQVWRIRENRWEAVQADDLLRFCDDFGDKVPAYVHLFLRALIPLSDRKYFPERADGPHQQRTVFSTRYSLRRIGRSVARSSRSMRRALRWVEPRGLVRTRQINGFSSLLEIDTDQFVAFARACKVAELVDEHAEREDVAVESLAGRDRHRWLIPTPTVLKDGRVLDRTVIADTVTRMLELVLGHPPTDQERTHYARVTVRLLNHCNWPDADRICEDVALVLGAARTCVAPEFRELRGVNAPKKRRKKMPGDRPGDGAGRPERRFRQDHASEPAWLFYLGKDPFHPAWDTRLHLAREHFAGRCRCGQEHPPEPTVVQQAVQELNAATVAALSPQGAPAFDLLSGSPEDIAAELETLMDWWVSLRIGHLTPDERATALRALTDEQQLLHEAGLTSHDDMVDIAVVIVRQALGRPPPI